MDQVFKEPGSTMDDTNYSLPTCTMPYHDIYGHNMEVIHGDSDLDFIELYLYNDLEIPDLAGRIPSHCEVWYWNV